MKICYHQDPVPERPISTNPGLNILFHFRIYLPMHGLEQHSVLSSLNLEVKTPQYFVSSSDMFLDKKTLFKILVNPGLNLTIFRGTGPRVTTAIGVVRVTNWRHYLFYLQPYFSALGTFLPKSFAGGFSSNCCYNRCPLSFRQNLWDRYPDFLEWRIRLKLDNLDVRPLSVESKALLKCNFSP